MMKLRLREVNDSEVNLDPEPKAETLFPGSSLYNPSEYAFLARMFLEHLFFFFFFKSGKITRWFWFLKCSLNLYS